MTINAKRRPVVTDGANIFGKYQYSVFSGLDVTRSAALFKCGARDDQPTP